MMRGRIHTIIFCYIVLIHNRHNKQIVSTSHSEIAILTYSLVLAITLVADKDLVDIDIRMLLSKLSLTTFVNENCDVNNQYNQGFSKTYHLNLRHPVADGYERVAVGHVVH